MFPLHLDARSLKQEIRHMRFLKSCLNFGMKHEEILQWEDSLRQNIADDLKQLKADPNMTPAPCEILDANMMTLLLMEDLLDSCDHKVRKPSRIPVRIQPKRPLSATKSETQPSRIPRPIKTTDKKASTGKAKQTSKITPQVLLPKPRWCY